VIFAQSRVVWAASSVADPAAADSRTTTKPTFKPLPPSKPAPEPYAKPTPKVSRQKTAKVLTAAEKAAFLASRPDLNSKS
jgi:hypothetical protein